MSSKRQLAGGATKQESKKRRTEEESIEEEELTGYISSSPNLSPATADLKDLDELVSLPSSVNVEEFVNELLSPSPSFIWNKDSLNNMLKDLTTVGEKFFNALNPFQTLMNDLDDRLKQPTELSKNHFELLRGAVAKCKINLVEMESNYLYCKLVACRIQLKILREQKWKIYMVHPQDEPHFILEKCKLISVFSDDGKLNFESYSLEGKALAKITNHATNEVIGSFFVDTDPKEELLTNRHLHPNPEILFNALEWTNSSPCTQTKLQPKEL